MSKQVPTVGPDGTS